jgi:uncharacterized protein
MALAAVPFGLAIGLTLGMLGGGGSALAVPVLVYALGQTVHQAITTSLVVVSVGAFTGAAIQARQGRVCWRHAGAFTAAALPGVIGGTALGNMVSGTVLIAGFAVIMLAVSVATWRKANAKPDGSSAAEGRLTCPQLRLAQGLAAGLLVGTMTGFFGVGGGFLIVPTLAIMLAFSMRLAIGTSLTIIAATSLMALVTHLIAGRTIDPGITASMTLASILGAFVGVRLARLIPIRQLGEAFAVLVAGVGVYLFISAAFLGGPPGTS